MGRRIGTYIVAAALGTFAAGTASAQGTTTTTQPQDPQSSAQQSGRDEAKSRQALVQARETLAEVTKMPEASQLQGQARTEVAQLINNFNTLLGAEANWYESYQAVMRNVYNIVGPATPDEMTGGGSTTTGTTGTTGSGTTGSAAGAAAGSAEIPSAIRNKLTQFRQQLMEFGRAAGAPDVTGGVSSATAAESGSMSGSTSGTTTGSTSGTTGTTSGTTSGTSSATGSQTQGESIEQHIDAINDILQQAQSGAASGTTGTTGSTSGTGTTGSTTGSMTGTTTGSGPVTLDREQLDRIQSHLQRIRELSRQKGVR